MGFVLPSPDSPPERARALMARKDDVQADLDAQFSILSANQSTMNSPLIDTDGFPRADIDVYAVRHARVRIIELRNDMQALMDEIGKALEGVYNPDAASTSAFVEPIPRVLPEGQHDTDHDFRPFAKVDGVAPGSPAATAGLQREDVILQFGSITSASFTSSSLQPLAEYVSEYQNRPLSVKVRRGSSLLNLTFTPALGWGGRGMLGCHIVPWRD